MRSEESGVRVRSRGEDRRKGGDWLVGWVCRCIVGRSRKDWDFEEIYIWMGWAAV